MMFRYYDKGIMVGYSYLGTDGKEVAKISLQGNELKVTCYYKNGKKSVQGYRKNGLLEGDYIEYHPNGQVSEKSVYKFGEEQGKFEVFSETGAKINTALGLFSMTQSINMDWQWSSYLMSVS